MDEGASGECICVCGVSFCAPRRRLMITTVMAIIVGRIGTDPTLYDDALALIDTVDRERRQTPLCP